MTEVTMNNLWLLPAPIHTILNRIQHHGGEAYVVGGAVRDFFLSRDIHDYDIATSLAPDTIESIFQDVGTYPTGKRFGTITVVMDGIPVEITTYRGEKGYSDRRHPDDVFFVSDIELDLSRRDFTINAMAYNPLISPCLRDPYNGLGDCRRQIIRTVGKAEERFSEDPLRIMRAIRFAAQLNFTLADEVLQAMMTLHKSVFNVSPERIKDELLKILLSSGVVKGLIHMTETGILEGLFPDYPSSPMACAAMEQCPPYTGIRLCALICCMYPEQNNSEAIEGHLRNLRLDSIIIKQVMRLYHAYNELKSIEITPFQLRSMLAVLGESDFSHLLQWYDAHHSHQKNTNDMKKSLQALILLDKIIKNQDPIYLSDLAINGNDIVAAGIGHVDKKLVGDALKTAHQWVLQDPSVNNKLILLNRLMDLYL